MARPNQEAIDTFISITGASESIAIQKLLEYGTLNEAVNAHFSEGDRSIPHEPSVAAPPYEFMDVDDPIQVPNQGPPLSLLPFPRSPNPFSLLDPNNLTRTIFDSGPSFEPIISHPRQVREIPIEVKDGKEQPSNVGPTIQEITESESKQRGPEIHGTVVIDDEDDDDVDYEMPTTPRGLRGSLRGTRSRPSALRIDEVPVDINNDIEEEMIRAAIEASKRDSDLEFANESDNMPMQNTQPPVEDAELAHAVSLSLKTAQQEKAVREMAENVGPSEFGTYDGTEMEEFRKLSSSNGGMDLGGSSYIHDEVEDEEEQPLVRHRSRNMSSESVEASKETGDIEISPTLSPIRSNSIDQLPRNQTDFPAEWGGISSEEHDEAVMLEAALFGGIPEGSGYGVPHHFTQNGVDSSTVGPYPRPAPRPPSPSLTAQRLIREQQDDEYHASLQADREKELKAIEEAEAAVAEDRRKEEESRKKFHEEQELERQLAAKEASLPEEPSPDDENTVNILVRMPDGSRFGRRFLRSHKLLYLFDFIDVGKVVKPGSYRLVRPYPRRAFSDRESGSTLNELGLSSKQEALFLESI